MIHDGRFDTTDTVYFDGDVPAPRPVRSKWICRLKNLTGLAFAWRAPYQCICRRIVSCFLDQRRESHHRVILA